jgi:glycosyltransferase involved in cell wall biosynthesis
MTLGCPIVVADLPAVREACGDAAVYISPDDPAALATALMHVAGDAGTRERMRTRGLVRARELTWRDSAVRLLAEIRPCIA